MSLSATRDPEGRVYLRNSRQPDPDPSRHCTVFTPRDWEMLLFLAASGELEWARLPLAACPLPLADTLGDRLM